MLRKTQEERECRAPLKTWRGKLVPKMTSNFVQLDRLFHTTNQFYSTLVSAEHFCDEGRRKKFFGIPTHRSAQHDRRPDRLLPRPIMCFCLQYKGKIPQEFFYYNMLFNSVNTVGSWVYYQGREGPQRPTQPFQRKMLVASTPERSWSVSTSFSSECGVRMLECMRAFNKTL